MRRFVVLVGLVIALTPGACSRSPIRVADSPGTASPGGRGQASSGTTASDELRRVVAEFQSRQQNAAVVVGVRHRGVTVFREATGFARLEERVPADPDMVFSIASITKAFTGAALLKMVETGRLDLDAEIQRYVPGFPRHPSGRPVTLRLLAHHLGAVRHWGPERNDTLYARHFDRVHDILAFFKADPWVPDLAPLTRCAYSSYGYNTIAMAIEQAAGRSFQAWLSETVLRPLRLTSVEFDRPGLGGARRPWRYSWYDLKDFHELQDAPQRVPDWDYSHNMAGRSGSGHRGAGQQLGPWITQRRTHGRRPGWAHRPAGRGLRRAVSPAPRGDGRPADGSRAVRTGSRD